MSDHLEFHLINIGRLLKGDADAYFEAPPEKQARWRAWYKAYLSGEPFQGGIHAREEKLI